MLKCPPPGLLYVSPHTQSTLYPNFDFLISTLLYYEDSLTVVTLFVSYSLQPFYSEAKLATKSFSKVSLDLIKIREKYNKISPMIFKCCF